MTDRGHKMMNVLNFSQTFVKVVDNILFPPRENVADQSDIYILLMKPLKAFLDRHRMEMYFLYREELARFKQELDSKSFKELLESMISDMKADEYVSEVFSYFCIVISFFAAVSLQNVPAALKVAARVIFDTIEHYEKDDAIVEAVIESIINSLMKTAEKIVTQKKSNVKNENCN